MNPNDEKKQVEMTAEELTQFEQFKAERAMQEKVAKIKQERAAYKALVNETLEKMFPALENISNSLKLAKENVYESFKGAIEKRSLSPAPSARDINI